VNTPDLPASSATLLHLLLVSKRASALTCVQSAATTNAWHLEQAASGWEALERVQSGRSPEMVLLDFAEQDAEGLHTLRWLKRLSPHVPVLVLTPAHDLTQKTESIRLGASEYLVTPLAESQIEVAIRRHIPCGEENDFEVETEDIEDIGQGNFFIAASAAMRRLRTQAGLLAQLDAPILITGEPGSGKESLARLIHKLSLRSGFRFLKLSCAALSQDALESELFGAEGTSSYARPARLELCDKGTLLFDEVSELPAGLQGTLLHALQEKRYTVRDGVLQFDVRVIATSSADIGRMLAAKTLREDLYCYLSAFTMHIPPLRERKREIPLLLGRIMSQTARHYSLQPGYLSSELMQACQNYSWPGNLTQLESFVKRYLVTRDEEAALNELQSGPGVWEGNHTGNGAADHGDIGPSSGLKSLIQNVKGEAERTAILGALEQTHWNRRAAARLLQVSYRTLLYKIQQYNMSPAGYSLHNGNGHRGNGTSR
jgi:two-component system, NtrC family, response regulator AtoC